MSFLGNLFSTGGREARATKQAANIAADAQRGALSYLQQREAVPMQIRDQALQGLAGYFQIPGQQMDQSQLIEQARMSPLYQAILGTRQAGEDAILRNASATGNLRSGGSISQLSDYGMQLENQALLTSFQDQQQRQDQERQLQLQGLSGLAGLPSNDMAIANLMSGIGQTQAMGIQGAAQARSQAGANSFNNLLGLGQLGLSAYGAFSDIRLKTNIRHIGKKGSHEWYKWEWNDEAKKLGLEGSSEGVLAHQVWETNPEAVGIRDGYLAIDYDRLGLAEAA